MRSLSPALLALALTGCGVETWSRSDVFAALQIMGWFNLVLSPFYAISVAALASTRESERGTMWRVSLIANVLAFASMASLLLILLGCTAREAPSGATVAESVEVR